MQHLNELLSNCIAQKKVVITDSLFSMEGDFALMLGLVELRENHGFLFVIDDAHTILVCGKSGGGITEVDGIEDQIDICVGTLSKAVATQGGFITCINKWRNLISATPRPSSSTPPVPSQLSPPPSCGDGGTKGRVAEAGRLEQGAGVCSSGQAPRHQSHHLPCYRHRAGSPRCQQTHAGELLSCDRRRCPTMRVGCK